MVNASITDIMHIGISSLSAYEQSLDVASQNIANADTPSYSRREVCLEESPDFTGVNVSEIKRIYSDAANQSVQQSKSKFGSADVYLQQIKTFEPVFDDSTTSVSTYIASSLDALNKLNGNVSVSSNRDLYMSSLTQLASRFQDVNNKINQEIANTNTSISTEITEANNILSSLASINSTIAAGGALDMDHLLDQRQGLVEKLAQYFNFNTAVDQNGLLNVTLSNGFGLLTSYNPAAQLAAVTDPANPNNLVVAVKQGSTINQVGNYFQSGELAGYINYRNNILEQSQRSLSRLGLAFSQTLNAQNKLGIDANGNFGGNLFSDINNSSIMTSRAIANTGNTGSSSMSVNITDVTKLTTSDYKLMIGAGNTYTLTRISDNTVVSGPAALPTLPGTISVPNDGFTINLASGTFNAGDQYTISPTMNGANNMTLAITNSSQIALGWPVTTGVTKATMTASSSDISATVTGITNPSNSSFSIPKQLNPPLNIVFSVVAGVTTYSVVNATTSAVIQSGIPYTAGANIFPTPAPTSYDPGYQVKINGSNIQNGDVVNIQYTANSNGDNRNGEAIAGLYTKGVLQNGNPTLDTFSQGYNAITSNIAVQGNSAQTAYDSASVIQDQANQNRDAISGVSLEEETLNLDRFQQAYQASAQILNSVREILQTVIDMAKR